MHPVLFHIGSILIPSYGAVAAAGVLLALVLAQRTARMAHVDPTQVWNLCVVALFTAIASQRLLLVAANWSDLARHPAWMLTLAMVHHPLLAAVGILAGGGAAAGYARWRKLPVLETADALAAPLAFGLAFEQFGALLAGSGFGMEASTKLPWAVTYTSVLAARWSGAPLGIPLEPVQAYAAVALLTLACFLFLWMPVRRQAGDVAGTCLIGLGAIVFFTELWRDPEGRGLWMRGTAHFAIDAPQIAAIFLVIAGGIVLRERKTGDGEKDGAGISVPEPSLVPLPREASLPCEAPRQASERGEP